MSNDQKQDDVVKSALDEIKRRENNQYSNDIDLNQWVTDILNEQDPNLKINLWNQFRKKIKESNKFIDIESFQKLLEDDTISQEINKVS